MLFGIYTASFVKLAFIVVIALFGVNNKLSVPVVMVASNTPNSEPVFISPYCARYAVVSSCTKFNSIIWYAVPLVICTKYFADLKALVENESSAICPVLDVTIVVAPWLLDVFIVTVEFAVNADAMSAPDIVSPAFETLAFAVS